MITKNSLKAIRKLVEDRLEIEDISTNNRRHDLVYARFMYFKLAKNHTRNSLHKIAREVNRDHSSVVYGINKFDDLYEYDKTFKNYKDTHDELDDFLTKGKIFEYNNKDLLDLSSINNRLTYLESIVQNLIYENRQNTVGEVKIEVGDNEVRID